MNQDEQGLCGYIAIVGVGCNNSQAARAAEALLKDVPSRLLIDTPDKKTGKVVVGLSDDLYKIDFPLIHAHKQVQIALGLNTPSLAHVDTDVAFAQSIGKPQSGIQLS